MRKIKKKIKNIKKLPNWMIFLFALSLKCMGHCLFKVKIEDPNGYIQLEENFILTLWHNRILFLPVLFPAKVKTRTKAVVSASRDGQYVADMIAQAGLKSVRGSSSYRGAKAQREALKAIQGNYHIACTPDGPRGPKYHMHLGPVHLATSSACRIIPVSLNASRYWQLQSWDNFQIPKPFSRLTIVVGEALSVPQGISTKEELELWRKKAEDNLMKITQD